MTDESAPIYNDRNIGYTSIQTAFLVDALLGQGTLGGIPGNAKYGAMFMAAKILSDHYAVINDLDLEPETVVRAIRDAAWRSEQVDKKGDAVSDAELSEAVEKNEKCIALCREMARIIVNSVA